MTNALLLRLFTSEFFNSWIAVSYLFRYSDNVGIQHYLCGRLKRFPVSEIEFFLPQLIHLLITRPSDSVALESFLVEMCEKSTHMALMTLWYLQAYLSDLSINPNSPSFALCKRLLNKCQAIVFSNGDNDQVMGNSNIHSNNKKIKENAIPALVGMGAILLGIGQPRMTKPAARIAIAQGRRNRTFSITSRQEEELNNNNTKKTNELSTVARRNTVDVATTTATIALQQNQYKKSTSSEIIINSIVDSKHHSDLINSRHRRPVSTLYHTSPSLEDLHRGKAFSMSRYIKNAQQKINQKITRYQQQQQTDENPENDNETRLYPPPSSLSNHLSIYDPNLTALGQSSVPTNAALPSSPALSNSCYCCSSSTEEITIQRQQRQQQQKARICKHSKLSCSFDSTPPVSLTSSVSSSTSSYSSDDNENENKEEDNMNHLNNNNNSMSHYKQRSLLRSNYFRSEMQFLLALVDIATRLVIVPKEARMSALHAELTLLNHNLPAEICLPLWCPATSEKPFHHRIVRISPADAVVLNSAERAPYLLMIEVLDDEMSFEDTDYAFMMKKRQKQYECTALKKGNKKKKNKKKKASSVAPKLLEDVVDMGDYYKNEVKHQQEEEEVVNTKSAANIDNYTERMRTAAIMLAQLQQSGGSCHPTYSNQASFIKSKPQETDQIRQRIIKEMMALEEQRILNIKTKGGLGLINNETNVLQDEQRIAMVVNKEDPSAAILSEDWETKKARLRAASPYGHLPNWRLISVIVKNGADLRQEQFALQLIREIQLIWTDTNVDVWVKYFRILVTSDSSGLMETLRNTISIHSIKKHAYSRGWNQKDTVFTLNDYFEKTWGPPDSKEFLKAQDAFMRSLAGYSIACYVLQIKDRHNGNLLIDESGHLIHIDFGFMLSNSPGSVGFEMAPFKLPQEYIDILGGIHGEKFAEYKALMKAAFLAVRKHSENILLLTEMMSIDSKLPCFQNGEMTVAQLRDRFQLHLTEPQAEEFVDKLIMSSCCNVFTKLYDTFQYYSQGIL